MPNAWRVGSTLLALFAALSLPAQSWDRGTLYAPRASETDTVAPPLLREFRAAWLATVSNIDWPSRPGLSTAEQQAELIRLLDIAKRINLNAIVFQVRPAADAIYPSKLEPWSYFLTGQMGRAPSPAYDPLAFAVTEAHKRGIELHAWFNPYRARHPDDTSRRASPTHLSRTAPALVKQYGPFGWMDPGEPAVRRRTVNVILDVVKRYDIDGVHMDDYFYPYPVNDRRGREVPFPDDPSYRRYVAAGGKLERGDWRRSNVDQLIREIYDGVKAEKPWVKVGISPFGIWRPGFPSVVRGFDAYEKLYGDSKRWLNEGWLDYATPQLYWRVTARQQPYGALLEWWAQENTKARHLWPGNFTGRASAKRSTSWPISEVFDQIRVTRERLGGASGNVHFPMTAFLHNTDSLVERLEAGPYAEPALVPESPWLRTGAVSAPRVRATASERGVELAIAVDATAAAQSGSTRRSNAPRFWLIQALYADGWRARIVDANVRVVRLPSDDGDAPRYVTVRTIDRVGAESPPVVVSPAN